METHFGTDISSWVPIAQLYNASKAGNKNVVQTLLAQGVHPNSKDKQGRTLLWWSASAGRVPITNLLLKQECMELNESDNNGWTPLHVASSNGHVEVVKLLLDKRADFSVTNTNGRTPLHVTSSNEHVEVVKLLLRKGAIANIVDKRAKSALTLASKNGHESIVAILLSTTILSEFSRSGLGQLIQALAYGGCLSQLQTIIAQYHIDYEPTDSQGINAAHAAARGGHLSTLEFLLTAGTTLLLLMFKGMDFSTTLL